jgi:hypothetical protein
MDQPMAGQRSEISDDDVHEWISFDLDGETYTFDATWLTSNWKCIYGDGCLGIEEEPDEGAMLGCCSHGAHFADKEDRKRVAEVFPRLRDDEWQFKEVAASLGGPIHKDHGDWVTRRHEGACIFLNRPGFPGGAGCAFHTAAESRGENFIDWKPEVCWQVPVRLDFHIDDNEYETNILREWKRRDWGEGGADFHWWCTEDPRAFVGDVPVYVSSKDEIIALVGQGAYDRVVELIEQRGTSVSLPHPSLKRAPASTD